MLRADNLADAIAVFDPRAPLEGETLAEFYVNRPRNPLKRMEIYFQGLRDRPVKMLFSGHRGCGKSTELNKLVEELRHHFFVVPVPLPEFVNLNTLTYQDVLLGMALRLFKHAAESDALAQSPAQAVKNAWDTVSGFLRDKIYGPAMLRAPAHEGEVGFKIGAGIAELELKYNLSTTARESLAQYVDNHFDELHAQMDLVTTLARDELKRTVLFVVEGTDKTEINRARDIFFGHSNALNGFRNAAAIYTFPIELAYSSEFNQIQGAFDRSFSLPNLNLTHRDGTPDHESLQRLGEMVSKRLAPECIEPRATEMLVQNSGGLARSLVKLVRSAAVYALSHGEARCIGADDAWQAVAEERRDFVRLLKSEHYPVLARRHQDKTLSADPAEQDLLQSLALLEYSNDEAWCDVHPAALPEVEKRARVQPET